MADIMMVFSFDERSEVIFSCKVPIYHQSRINNGWVVDKLGFADLFDMLLPTMSWNSLMASYCFFFFSSK
ncbi:hypothetical protein EUGRSUZ_K01969 [Eucalyptus grandis]|uniref:Uncharacterized protein n=2 Tax=Eucalyptus grandis TaxID=71139 RepID=A0ACC3KWQ6_EUCGR|nr:hypothetical protein EUGRSUZ_K01969 [Eucalyptus grandis]